MVCASFVVALWMFLVAYKLRTIEDLLEEIKNKKT
jgi:hypothetical protein